MARRTRHLLARLGSEHFFCDLPTDLNSEICREVTRAQRVEKMGREDTAAYHCQKRY